MECFKNLPHDIVYEILDYFNYEKYCKPIHKELFSKTLGNINNFRSIFPNKIKPFIILKCLGKGNIDTIEDWGILNLRNFIIEVLEPYHEHIMAVNRYRNLWRDLEKIQIRNEKIRKERQAPWPERRKKLIKNKLEKMFRKRIEYNNILN